MFAIFLLAIFLGSGALADTSLLAVSCAVDVNLEYNGDLNNPPGVTCKSTCSEIPKGWHMQRMYYKEDRLSGLNLMVQITVSQKETLLCNLVPVASNSLIAETESSTTDNAECKPVFKMLEDLEEEKCGPGYEFNEKLDKCYRVSDYPAQWPDAECACAQSDGILAIIDTPEKQKEFQSMTKETVWIGLSDMDKEGTFAWRDGTNFVYSNFDKTQSADTDGTKDCVEMNAKANFQWRDNACSAQNKFICEEKEPEVTKTTTTTTTTTPKPTTTTTIKLSSPSDTSDDSTTISTTSTTTTPKPTRQICPSDWKLDPVSKKCYHLGTKSLTYEDSNNYCKGFGGTFAAITSGSEFDFVKTVIGKTSAYIGLSDSTSKNDYRWKSGEFYSFNRWASGQPSKKWRFSWSNKNCVEMDNNNKKSYFWNSIDCAEERRPLCEMPSETFPRESCPSGWRQHGKQCFSLRPSEVDFKSAKSYCPLTAYGAKLATPANIAESKVFGKMVKKAAYLGVNNISDKNEFVDVLQQKLKFTNWKNGKPSTSWVFDKFCTEIDPKGKWDNISCEEDLPFLCSMDLSDSNVR